MSKGPKVTKVSAGGDPLPEQEQNPAVQPAPAPLADPAPTPIGDPMPPADQEPDEDTDQVEGVVNLGMGSPNLPTPARPRTPVGGQPTLAECNARFLKEEHERAARGDNVRGGAYRFNRLGQREQKPLRFQGKAPAKAEASA